MTFVKAGAQHDFEAKAVGVTKGAPAKFTISAYPTAGAKVLATGDETAQAGGVKHKWKAEGPPTDANGVRSWRVAYEVTVDVERDGAKTQLKAPSQEVDVFHDWVELTTVKEDGGVYANAIFDVVVTMGGREVQRIKAKSTGKTGVLKVTGLKGGDVSVVFKAPHELVKWESGTGCKLKAKVRLVPKAVLVWPKPDKKGQHFQLVNLPVDAAKKEQGSVCKLTLKLEGGKAGDKVHVKTSYAPATTSPRSTHTRGIKSPDSPVPAWAGAAPNTGKKATVAARNGGFEVDVEVECGIAGGDEITVAAGGTEACSEVKLTIVTRRKIKFEVLKPKPAVSTVASNAAASSVIAKAVTTALDALGITDEVDSTKTYDVADLPSANVVHDGAYFGQAAGTKIVVLTQDQYVALKSKSAYGSSTTGLISTIMWGDYIAMHGPTRGQFSSVLPASFYGEATTITIPGNGKNVVLPYDPRNPGSPAVHSIRWCTGAYKSGGQWIEYANDPDDGTPLGSAGSTSPGGAKSAWQVVSPTAANVAKYVDFTDYKTFKIKCPSADANDPGKFLVDGGTKVAILVEVEVYYIALTTLIGAAAEGFIGMTTGGGNFTAQGMAEVILHEMGHNLGVALVERSKGSQPYGGGTANFGQTASPPSGPIAGLKFDEKGDDGNATGTKLDMPQFVPNGLVYVDKGHIGPHCAFGLTRAQRDRTNYSGLSGKCLMFGYADAKTRTVRAFCAQCTSILRARDVSNIRRKWWV